MLEPASCNQPVAVFTMPVLLLMIYTCALPIVSLDFNFCIYLYSFFTIPSQGGAKLSFDDDDENLKITGFNEYFINNR